MKKLLLVLAFLVAGAQAQSRFVLSYDSIGAMTNAMLGSVNTNAFVKGWGLFQFTTATNPQPNGGTVFAPAAGIATGRWVLKPDAPTDVTWFGANGNDLLDDTAAVNAAYCFARTNTGTLRFPPATRQYLFNLVITNSSIRILGDNASMARWYIGSSNVSVVKAWDPQRAVIQVGADLLNTYTDNVRIENLGFEGGAVGRCGLFVAGGTIYTHIKDCVFNGWTNAVIITAGTNAPTQFVQLRGCSILVPVLGSTTRGVVVSAPHGGNQWISRVGLSDNTHIWKWGGGHGLEVDGTGVHLSDTHFDGWDISPQVLLTNDVAATNPNYMQTPHVWAENVMFDGDGSTPLMAVPVTYANFRRLSQFVSGDFWMGGRIQTTDGTNVVLTARGILEGSGTELESPVIEESLLLREANSPAGSKGDFSTYLRRQSNNLQIAASNTLSLVTGVGAKGAVTMYADGGNVEISGPTNALIVLRDVAAGKEGFIEMDGNILALMSDGIDTQVRVMEPGGHGLYVTALYGTFLNSINDKVVVAGELGIHTSESVTPTSRLHVGGPIATAIEFLPTGLTLGNTNSTVLLTAASDVVKLPSASGIAGRIYTIKAINACTSATINTASTTCYIGDTGLTNISLTASNKFVTLQCDGTNWWVIGSN